MRPQRLQSKVTPGTVVVETSLFFLLWRFSLRLFLQESSKEETAWWIMWRQVTRQAARVDHWQWSMWQALRDFFRESLHRFLGAALLRWPAESWPYMAILGSRGSFILETCPSQRNCDFSSMASMLVISACSRT